MRKWFKYIPVSFLLIGLAACGNGDEEQLTVPPNIISEGQLTKILADFALAESATNLNIINKGGPQFDSAYAFNPLKENGVTKSQYDSSLAFYSRHPETLKKIHEDVLTLLNDMSVKRTPVNTDSVKKKDSLK